MMADIMDFIRPTNAFELAAFAKNHHDTYQFIEPIGTELSGKSILITGASKGIGRATAVRCAKAGCARIAVAARSSLEGVIKEIKDEAAKCGIQTPHILPLRMDVTSDESVKAASQNFEATFGGKLDILVNNAGYLPEFKTVIESDPTEWWKAWEVNVKGTFLCCHYFLPFVLNSKTKTVINLSSIGAHTLSYGASSYQTSRFANVRLNEFLAREYEDDELIAISIHPGGIKTDMAANFPEMLHFSLADEPTLPADTIIWLAKERRNWLNGRFVWSNWDLEEVESKQDLIVQNDLFKFRMTG
jgi:NAD(P)-dependent dehydrogenase (short-subunit alcohol dehydrogenase family)